MRPEPLVRRLQRLRSIGSRGVDADGPAAPAAVRDGTGTALPRERPPARMGKPAPAAQEDIIEISSGKRGTGREPPTAALSGAASSQAGLPTPAATEEGAAPAAPRPATRMVGGPIGGGMASAKLPPKLLPLPRYGEMEKRWDRRLREMGDGQIP